jgi:hypothetical protein
MVNKTRVLEITDLDVELKALNENCLAEQKTWYITHKQVTTLASLMGSGLKDRGRENRLNVLRLLCQDAVFTKTGFVIESTKQIPGEIAAIIAIRLWTTVTLSGRETN